MKPYESAIFVGHNFNVVQFKLPPLRIVIKIKCVYLCKVLITVPGTKWVP